MLAGLATWIHQRARIVLFVAVLGAVVTGAVGFSVAKHLSPYGAEDPATQSVLAKHRFEHAAGRQLDAGVVALVTPSAGAGATARAADVRSPAATDRVQAVARTLVRQPDVVRLLSYYDTHDPAMVSRDGRSTYVLAYFRPITDKRLSDDSKLIESRFAGQRDVRLGGVGIANAQVNAQVSRDLAHAELLAFPFIFILSLLFFRSLVAALLPPLLGGLAILATFFALRVANNFVDLSVFAVNLTTGLGLGLAIDYSLFIVSRYREESATSGFGVASLRRTLETAGRTVLFSSVTVAAAIAAMAIFPQRFLYSMGIAGAIVALIAASLALLVLPAVLAVLGPRVNALAPKRLQRAAERDAQVLKTGAWYRLSRFVMRRPAQVALASAAVLIAVGIPFAGIRFIAVDASVLPATASARQVDDTLNRDFPPHRTDPLELVAGAPAGSPQLRALTARIRQLPGVSAVAPPQPGGPATSLVEIAPVQAPLTDATQRLLGEVRALNAPFYAGVAGQTAAFVDLKHSLAAHLPAVISVVVGATLIVLFLMTGSVLLPVKAVLMNALSLSAVFGILVLIFQDGRLTDLLSYRSQGALETTQPIFLFVVGFGLATDYGVFLLSRIKEARDAGVPNNEAVAVGLERTGRIVTAAALLFAVAIGSFATSQIVFIKELGVGAALAVLIDASIIRALLVPSLMELLGPLNWWAPAPLRRLHDRIGLSEGGPAVAPSPGSG
jgi:RND superfamily putative drug exporter